MSNERSGMVGARNEARLLALLEGDESGGLTVAELRDQGIQDPGQAVYALQLGGHQIERVSYEGSDGRRRLGYRLCASSRASGRPHGLEIDQSEA